MTDTTLLYGLRVCSELPLHQRHVEFSAVDADVVITLAEPLAGSPEPIEGTCLARMADAHEVFYEFVQVTERRWVLRFGQVGDFEVEDLRLIRVRLFAGADPALAAVMLTGTVLAFVLTLLGEAVLHASAVQIGERAVAFVGFSGMGKSTMATLLCADGGALITDDLLRVDLSGAAVRCRLGATELRLRKSAAELASRFEGALSARVTADGRDALRPPECTVDYLPLAAIVFPLPDRQIDALSVERLDPATALLDLVRYPRLLGWRDPATSAQQFAHLATIAERVGVYRAQVPWGPPFAANLGHTLVERLGLRAR